jgi:histidinol-phosphate aminotransferase
MAQRIETEQIRRAGMDGAETVASAAGAAGGLSRRRFAQLLGAGMASIGAAGAAGAAAAAAPAGAVSAGGGGQRSALLRLLAPPEAATAAGSAAAVESSPSAAAAVVRLSSNENPYGPSAAALDAMRAAFGVAWRYPDEEEDPLLDEIARQNGVDPGQVLLGAGSSEILKLCAAAFTGAGRPAVTASPTFEALAIYARRQGAKVIAVPLTGDFRHDLPKMLAAAPETGVFYLCNPNNPTASITPRGEVRAFLAKVPARSMALVDEAYFHYVESDDYESVVPLVEEHPNLIVTRTFSKVYGMAGVRCGYALARPEVIARLREQQAFSSVSVLAMTAARASLLDSDQVVRGRRLNRESRATVCQELDRLGFSYIPSSANFLMIDLRQPAAPVIAAMAKRRVEVGRAFPALPNHLRVTVGTPEQMHGFLGAFREVMAERRG